MGKPAMPDVPGDWTNDFPTGNGSWTLGPFWLDRARGCLALFIEDRHCNAFGVMHGGAMATFADGQGLAVCDYTGRPSDHTPTVSLSVDYLKPAPVETWLVAEVTLLRTTRSLIFTQAIIKVKAQPVARSNAIYRNVER